MKKGKEKKKREGPSYEWHTSLQTNQMGKTCQSKYGFQNRCQPNGPPTHWSSAPGAAGIVKPLCHLRVST